MSISYVLRHMRCGLMEKRIGMRTQHQMIRGIETVTGRAFPLWAPSGGAGLSRTRHLTLDVHVIYTQPVLGASHHSRQSVNPGDERLLLANPIQGSRSTFSRRSFLSFIACKEGMLGTPISVLGGLANSIRALWELDARRSGQDVLLA